MGRIASRPGAVGTSRPAALQRGPSLSRRHGRHKTTRTSPPARCGRRGRLGGTSSPQVVAPPRPGSEPPPMLAEPAAQCSPRCRRAILKRSAMSVSAVPGAGPLHIFNARLHAAIRRPTPPRTQGVVAQRIAARSAALAQRRRLARQIYATTLAARIPGTPSSDLLQDAPQATPGWSVEELRLMLGLRRSSLAYEHAAAARGPAACARAVQQVLLPSGCEGAPSETRAYVARVCALSVTHPRPACWRCAFRARMAVSPTACHHVFTSRAVCREQAVASGLLRAAVRAATRRGNAGGSVAGTACHLRRASATRRRRDAPRRGAAGAL